ncbi:MAG: MazG family protein [Opitutales bacterium]
MAIQPADRIEEAFNALHRTVARLRAPDGCPWDREQTHQTLAACLVDECAELLETLDNGDRAHMLEELGDVLCQVVMHAQLAEEDGVFDLADVATAINDKLIRRHPHVFGDAETRARLADSEAVLQQWEAIKAEEKPERRERFFKPLPPRLPALMFAHDIVKQVDKKGAILPETVDARAINAATEGLTEQSAGEQLFTLAAACQREGIDPESALRRYAAGVMDRVEATHD